MRFNTHDRTPREPFRRRDKVLLAVSAALIYALFVLAAVVFSIETHSPLPALLILLPVLLLTAIVAIMLSDVEKAYIEIDGDRIRVVDYYFGIKKEKCFSLREIERAKRVRGYSFLTHGYQLRFAAYLQFRGANGKYLFKVMDCPETEAFFRDFLKDNRPPSEKE